MAELTDERIEALRRIYNDAYSTQRINGVSGGDAERSAMRTLLDAAEVADQGEPVARVAIGPFAPGDEPSFQFIEGKSLPDGVHDLFAARSGERTA